MNLLQSPEPATCTRKTSKGVLCRRRVHGGTKFCWQHSHSLKQKWRSLTGSQTLIFILCIVGPPLSLAAWMYPDLWNKSRPALDQRAWVGISSIKTDAPSNYTRPRGNGEIIDGFRARSVSIEIQNTSPTPAMKMKIYCCTLNEIDSHSKDPAPVGTANLKALENKLVHEGSVLSPKTSQLIEIASDSAWGGD